MKYFSKFLLTFSYCLLVSLQIFVFTPNAFSSDHPEPPPPPAPPYLQKPVDPNFDGTYLVDWSDVECAANFQLQESSNPQFFPAANFYLSGNTSQKEFTKTAEGIYYYRVKVREDIASSVSKLENPFKFFLFWLKGSFAPLNAYADGPCNQIHLQTAWSNVQSITVTKPTSFIDGVVYQAGTEAPISDAVITSPDFVGSVTSAVDGKFSFGFQSLFPETGKLLVTINIEKTGNTSAQRVVEVTANQHAAAGPIHLTTQDPITTTITPAGGTHVNSTNEIELVFPAGAVTEDIEVNSTKYQEGKALPNDLPETSFFTYALNLNAETSALYKGAKKKVTTFQEPITMRVANTLGFAAGTPIPAGVYNEVTKQWEDTGLMGQISADGQWLEFQIDHFSPWDLNLPAPPPPQNRAANVTKNNSQDIVLNNLDCANDCGASRVGIKSGVLSLDYSLPPIKRLDSSFSPTFSYNSLTAKPSSPIVIETDLNTATTNIPATTTFKVGVAGREAQAIYQGVSGKVRYAYLFDGKDSQGNLFPTGSYQYNIEASNNYTNTTYWTTANFAGAPISDTGVVTIEPVPLTRKINGNIIINNQANSSLGAGWNLNGLQRLYLDPTGKSILLTEGDGSAIVFSVPRPDLAVGNAWWDNTVSILLGKGDGMFRERLTFLTGNVPNSIDTADFNHDGFADLAVVNCASNTVSILLGKGDGMFQNQTILSVKAAPLELVARSDFNKDGHYDLAVTNRDDNSVSILLGKGDGTFQDQLVVPVVDSAYGIASADFNDDQHADLAVSTPSGVSILLGNGNGTFIAAPVVTIGSSPSALASADFNDDQHADLAAVSGLGVSIFLGNGNGTFITAPIVAVGNEPQMIVAADFNNDQLVDLAVPNYTSNTASVLLGNGNGTFQAPRTFATGNSPHGIAAADFNQDDFMDLAVTNGSGSSISVLLGNGDGTFQEQIVSVALGSWPWPIVSGHFNSNPNFDFEGPPGEFSRLTKNENNTFTRISKDGSRINFNALGLETSSVDRNGNTTSYQYTDANSDGKIEELSWIVLPAGGNYHFIYDSNGKLQSITDPAGRITQVTVDASGDLIQIKNPDNTTMNFVYNNHLMTNKTTERGFTTEYQYDNHGRVKKTITPTNPQEERQYFPSDVQGLINDLAPGVGTPANPAPVVRPEDVVERVIDGKGYTTTSQTSKFGAYANTTDALSQTTTIDRDSNNNPVKITRPNNSTVSMSYDAKGNLLTSTEDTISATTTFTYEPNFNQVTSIKDARDNTTSIEYDTKGNPIQITDALSNITKMEYNSRGQVTKVTSGFGTALENNTLFGYYSNTLNLQTITDPLNNVTTFTYDDSGNILTSTDANNKTTTFEYDLMGRLTKVTDPDTKVTQYQYDEAGNLKKIIDAKLHETNFTYDEINQLKTIVNPLNKTKAFTYDLNRNLKTVTDFKNQTITFTYDEINRLTNKSGTGLNVTFGFDSVNNLTSALDADSSLTLGYDLAGRLTSAATANLGHQPATSMSFTFDKNSNRLTFTDPQSVVTKYVYDALNRLTDITDNADVNIAHFGFDELSRRTALNFPNSTSTAYGYDLASRLTSLVITGPTLRKTITPTEELMRLFDDFLTRNAFAVSASTVNSALSTVNSYTYTYDNVGNRETMTDSFGTHTYGYDNLYRLTSSTLPSEDYAYDEVGNRNPASFVYDAANRLLDDGTYTYTYDDNGNCITKTDKSNPSDVTTYTYDIENQLITVVHGLSTVDYKYDGLGRRIEKDVNGTVTRYVYDNEDIIAEYDGSNTLQAKYLHGPGIDEPIRMERGGQNYFYHADGLGSITAITNSTGATVKTYRYDAFGNIVSQIGTLANPFTYTGREYDAETGLYYYRARYYDARIGRFLQEDPVQDDNLYAYGNNNPINYGDPYGLFPIETFWDIANIGYDISSHDWKSLGWDIGATLIPYVPAGITKIGKGAKLADKCAIVIGESSERVAKKAARMGAEHYVPRKPLSAHPTVAEIRKAMRNNYQWLRNKVQQGYKIIDIGLDRSRTNRGIFYQAEKSWLRLWGK